MHIAYCLTTSLGLVLSIVTLVFVLSWKRQRGQGLMLAFVIIGIILPQLISLLLNISITIGQPFRANIVWVYTVTNTISWICNLAGSGLLLAYVACLTMAKHNPTPNDSQATSHRYLQSDSQTEFAATQPRQLPPSGPQWNVPPSPKLNVKILRQREWGFLIDFMPFILGTAGVVLILGMRYGAQGYSINVLNSQLWGLFWLIIVLQFLYALFKDCIGGRSVGKLFAGTRVVDFKTGEPAPAGQSILRNLTYLIPLFSIVELATASIRSDSRRLGDLVRLKTSQFVGDSGLQAGAGTVKSKSRN